MERPLLVVARYREPKLSYPWDTCVVQKGRDMPNCGREPSSYFWFMAREYERIVPERTYGFVQAGAPQSHGWSMNQLRQVTHFTPLGDWVVTCDWTGAPHHPGLPLGELWGRWEIAPERPRMLTFVAGACFLVPGSSILSRPREWYTRMTDEMCVEPSAPWSMERFWPYVWNSEKESL